MYKQKVWHLHFLTALAPHHEAQQITTLPSPHQKMAQRL